MGGRLGHKCLNKAIRREEEDSPRWPASGRNSKSRAVVFPKESESLELRQGAGAQNHASGAPSLVSGSDPPCQGWEASKDISTGQNTTPTTGRGVELAGAEQWLQEGTRAQHLTAGTERQHWLIPHGELMA